MCNRFTERLTNREVAAVETVVCVWSAEADWGCGERVTCGISPIGAAVMGGRTGREVGIMYSDSSSLSRVSSPVTGLWAADGLRSHKPKKFRI